MREIIVLLSHMDETLFDDAAGRCMAADQITRDAVGLWQQCLALGDHQQAEECLVAALESFLVQKLQPN